MTTALYSIARFVPDEVRDESVNIGVILEDRQQSKLYSAFASNFSRIARFDGSLPKFALEKVLKTYIEKLTSYTLNRGISLTSLVERYSGGKVQLTAPKSTVLQDAPEHEVEKLQRIFLLEDISRKEIGFNDARLKSDLRQTLNSFGIARSSVIDYSGRNHKLRFKGRRAFHDFDLRIELPANLDLFRCISFDVENYSEKVDAAKVLLVDTEDILASSRERVSISSILQPPRTFHNGQGAAFEEASAILREKSIQVYDFSQYADRQAVIDIAKSAQAAANVSHESNV